MHQFNLIQALHQSAFEEWNQPYRARLLALCNDLSGSNINLEPLNGQVSHSMAACENGLQEGVFCHVFESDDPLSIYRGCLVWLLEQHPDPMLEQHLQALRN